MSDEQSREESAIQFIEVLEYVARKMMRENGPVLYNVQAAMYCGLVNAAEQLKHEVKWEGLGLA